MRVTRSQIRRIVRESLLKESENLIPGALIDSTEAFRSLTPGSEITVNGQPAVVVNVDSFVSNVSYVKKGSTIRKNLDYGYAIADEPGDRPEIEVVYVNSGSGTAPKVKLSRHRPPQSYDKYGW